MEFSDAFLSAIKEEMKYTRYYNISEGIIIRKGIREFYHQNL